MAAGTASSSSRGSRLQDHENCSGAGSSSGSEESEASRVTALPVAVETLPPTSQATSGDWTTSNDACAEPHSAASPAFSR